MFWDLASKYLETENFEDTMASPSIPYNSFLREIPWASYTR